MSIAFSKVATGMVSADMYSSMHPVLAGDILYVFCNVSDLEPADIFTFEAGVLRWGLFSTGKQHWFLLDAGPELMLSGLLLILPHKARTEQITIQLVLKDVVLEQEVAKRIVIISESLSMQLRSFFKQSCENGLSPGHQFYDTGFMFETAEQHNCVWQIERSQLSPQHREQKSLPVRQQKSVAQDFHQSLKSYI